MNQIEKHGSHYGILYGIAAYGSWGIFPLYFKTVANVPPVEVLAHRALWSFVILAVLVGLLGRWKEVWRRQQVMSPDPTEEEMEGVWTTLRGLTQDTAGPR